MTEKNLDTLETSERENVAETKAVKKTSARKKKYEEPTVSLVAPDGPVTEAAEVPDSFESVEAEKETTKPEEISDEKENRSDSKEKSTEDLAKINGKTATRKNESDGRPRQIVTIDGTMSVVTQKDKANRDLIDLTESLKTGRILTGTLEGVEEPDDKTKNSLAVLYRGSYKIIIPADDVVTEPTDLRGQSPQSVMHYLLTKRLGAEIDYVVKHIDEKSETAMASRLDAMAERRKRYYYGTDRNGADILFEGVCAEARVVSVIRTGIFVELFGIETFIGLRELSYQRISNAADYFQTGQRILVKILRLDKKDKNKVTVNLSVKQASENPYAKALKRYAVGNRYVGTVSMVDKNGVFVALDGGIDCLCSFPKRGRPPRNARVTVKILGINHENNRIWGVISHSSMPR